MPLLYHFCGYPQVIYFMQKIKMLTLVRTMKYACRYLQISYENYFDICKYIVADQKFTQVQVNFF